MIIKKKDHSKWHTWFAWYPIAVTDDDGAEYWVWLSTVERSISETYYTTNVFYRLLKTA